MEYNRNFWLCVGLFLEVCIRRTFVGSDFCEDNVEKKETRLFGGFDHFGNLVVFFFIDINTNYAWMALCNSRAFHLLNINTYFFFILSMEKALAY